MPLHLPEIRVAGIAPELALSIAAIIILLIAAVAGKRLPTWSLPVMSSIGIVLSGAFAVATWHTSQAHTQLQLGNMVAVDGFSIFVKVALCAFGLLTVWLARDYLSHQGLEEAEFYALVLFAVAGMMLMASAADLILIFIALETFSLALYVLVGFRRSSVRSQEAAMKYFLLGSFSSAFFLLGIALTFGAVGSTNLYGAPSHPGIVTFLQSAPASGLGLLVLGMGFLVIGLGFKVAAVPFHMWTPDAYQGAPSPVTGFMAAGSKIAGFAALLRLLDVVLFPLRWDWRPLVIGVAIVTMVVGAVIAVVQEDVKRMLAYSAIAHAGFVLTGIVAANDRGISGALFYLATYGITVLGAFAVVSILAGNDERRVSLVDYKGLFYERPVLASALMLFLLSLAGVPPTVGFVGKLVVFGAAVEAGYWWLAIAGVVSSMIAAFFYLRVLVVMYMQEADESQISWGGGSLSHAVIGLAAIATVGLGLAWGPLIHVAEKATMFFSAG
ncbi:MAG: NADH-quinone oxidoreductase subunit N [Actinomycetota bacterium]|nr:NADH-quinone oxidoreductase subunit N [Actinomycetota bacterium]